MLAHLFWATDQDQNVIEVNKAYYSCLPPLFLQDQLDLHEEVGHDIQAKTACLKLPKFFSNFQWHVLSEFRSKGQMEVCIFKSNFAAHQRFWWWGKFCLILSNLNLWGWKKLFSSLQSEISLCLVVPFSGLEIINQDTKCLTPPPSELFDCPYFLITLQNEGGSLNFCGGIVPFC